MTQFERGEMYLINYGTFSKLATFLEKDDDKNYFRDSSGEFAFTDKFIKNGNITITVVETD